MTISMIHYRKINKSSFVATMVATFLNINMALGYDPQGPLNDWDRVDPSWPEYQEMQKEFTKRFDHKKCELDLSNFLYVSNEGLKSEEIKNSKRCWYWLAAFKEMLMTHFVKSIVFSANNMVDLMYIHQIMVEVYTDNRWPFTIEHVSFMDDPQMGFEGIASVLSELDKLSEQNSSERNVEVRIAGVSFSYRDEMLFRRLLDENRYRNIKIFLGRTSTTPVNLDYCNVEPRDLRDFDLGNTLSQLSYTYKWGIDTTVADKSDLGRFFERLGCGINPNTRIAITLDASTIAFVDGFISRFISRNGDSKIGAIKLSLKGKFPPKDLQSLGNKLSRNYGSTVILFAGDEDGLANANEIRCVCPKAFIMDEEMTVKFCPENFERMFERFRHDNKMKVDITSTKEGDLDPLFERLNREGNTDSRIAITLDASTIDIVIRQIKEGILGKLGYKLGLRLRGDIPSEKLQALADTISEKPDLSPDYLMDTEDAHRNGKVVKERSRGFCISDELTGLFACKPISQLPLYFDTVDGVLNLEKKPFGTLMNIDMIPIVLNTLCRFPIKHIIFRDNRLDSQGISRFADMLKTLPEDKKALLTCIECHDNWIAEDGVSKIIGAVERSFPQKHPIKIKISNIKRSGGFDCEAFPSFYADDSIMPQVDITIDEIPFVLAKRYNLHYGSKQSEFKIERKK